MHLTTRPATNKQKKKLVETNTNAVTNAQMNRHFLHWGHIHRGHCTMKDKDKKSAKKTNKQQEQLKWLLVTAGSRYFFPLFLFNAHKYLC